VLRSPFRGKLNQAIANTKALLAKWNPAICFSFYSPLSTFSFLAQRGIWLTDASHRRQNES